MKSAIYCRQSKERKESLSIESQIEKCAQLCHFKGKEYIVYQDKGYSGKNILRPAYEEMIADIKAGKINEIVVYRLDRISRNINDFTSTIGDFEKYGCTFASATESFDTSTPMGRAMMYLLAVFAQLERENISERLKDNKMYICGTLGKWSGGKVPTGYILKEDAEGKNRLEIEPSEAELVRMIFDEYIKPGGALRKIVRLLNNQGYKTKEGSHFTQMKLSRLIKNVFYCANDPNIYEYFRERDIEIQNKQEEFDGTRSVSYFQNKNYIVISDHPKIIESDVWIRANIKIINNGNIDTRPTHSKNTYIAGLIYCGMCKKKMQLKYTRQYLYAFCKTKIELGDAFCINKSTSVKRIEKAVEKYLFELASKSWNLKQLLTKRKKVNVQEAVKKADNSIRHIESSIKEKTKDLGALVDNVKHIRNINLLKAIEEESDHINSALEKLHAELETIKLQKNHLENYDNEYLQIQLGLKRYKEQWEYADMEDKKAIIGSIIKKIILEGETINIVIF